MTDTTRKDCVPATAFAVDGSRAPAPPWARRVVAIYAFLVTPLGLLGLVLAGYDGLAGLAGRVLCMAWFGSSVLLHPGNAILPLGDYAWPRPSLARALTGLMTRICYPIVVLAALILQLASRFEGWSDHVFKAALASMLIGAAGYGVRWLFAVNPDIAKFR